MKLCCSPLRSISRLDGAAFRRPPARPPKEHRGACPSSSQVQVCQPVSPSPAIDVAELFAIVQEPTFCNSSRRKLGRWRSAWHLHRRKQCRPRLPVGSADAAMSTRHKPPVNRGLNGRSAAPCSECTSQLLSFGAASALPPSVHMSSSSRCLLAACWLRCFVTRSAGLASP